MATIALTPQMLVPTAIRLPSRRGSPSARLIHVTRIKAVAMQPTMIGSPTRPIWADRGQAQPQAQKHDPQPEHVTEAELQPPLVDRRQTDRVTDGQSEQQRHHDRR